MYAYWTFWDGWSSDREFIAINASLTTNPFRACGYVTILSKDIGGCYPS